MKNLILLASILFLSSCVKEEYFEYPNRYFKTAEVLALPALNYDADNSAPDIRIDLKRRSANNWEFSTFTGNFMLMKKVQMGILNSTRMEI